MAVYKVLLHIFAFILFTSETPFIFDDSITTCSYSMKNRGGTIETNSETLSVKTNTAGQLIYFKLCNKFDKEDDHCPIGTTACIVNRPTGQQQILGRGFHLAEEALLTSVDGGPCKKGTTYSLFVHLRNSNKKPSYMYTEEQCTFHVSAVHPSFRSVCGLNMYGRFIDLSPLARNFAVHSPMVTIFKVHHPERNFSVTLCGSDESCGRTNSTNDVSACELDGDTITPLALTSTISPNYAGKNQLIFHGNYKGPTRRFDKLFEVILKCDWDKTTISNSDMQYVRKQTQGKRYSFELETSYGCIKKPIPCVVQREFLIYNLTGLYIERPDMWLTRKNDSKYFLQICGPGVLAGQNVSCRSTYAQVCENVNGTDVNRGSILSHLEVTNEGLTAIIDSGTTCKEANKTLQRTPLYTTIINFICDNKEYGPEFLNQTKCDTSFQWRTPHACPKYNTSSCSHLHKDFHDCNFYKDDKYYNLSALSTTQTVKDKKLQDVQFEVNICGPVVDLETPCMKDVSIARKKISEPNIRHRVVSLGKFRGEALEGGSLVLEYSTGAFCGGGDYSSEIRFECSENEEGLAFVKQEKCHYKFLWRTNHGCPRPSDRIFYDVSNNNCLYRNSVGDKSIDFGHIKPMAFDDGERVLTFHTCGKFYSNCTQSKTNCTNNVSFKNPTVSFARHVTTLEISLSKPCTMPEGFNKVTFNFLCDLIENNDHTGSWKKVDCDLSVEYFTNAVCAFQVPVPDTSSSLVKNKKVVVVSPEKIQAKELQIPERLPQETPRERVVDCSIKSPFTDQEINMRNFTIALFKNSCPTAIFNDTFRFVKLLYASNDVCRPIPSKNISYEVYLMCSTDVTVPPTDQACLQHYNYEQAEYCSFFKVPAKPSGAIIIGTVLVCVLVISLICAGFWAQKRRAACFRRSGDGFLNIYERDTQL